MAFFTVFRHVFLHKTKFHQGIDVFIGNRNHAAAFTTITTIRATARHKFLAAETGSTVTALACHDLNLGFVNKLHV